MSCTRVSSSRSRAGRAFRSGGWCFSSSFLLPALPTLFSRSVGDESGCGHREGEKAGVLGYQTPLGEALAGAKYPGS